MSPERSREDWHDEVWRVGPFVMDMRVSLSGALAVTMAMVAMIGGWYRFSYMQEAQQQAIIALKIEQAAEDKSHSEAEARIAETLNQTNNVLGRITQALNDKDGIRIKE